MKKCVQLCHLKHSDHASHCGKLINRVTQSQQDFFDHLRQEGRDQVLAKIPEVYQIANLEHIYSLQAFLALLKSKLYEKY